MTVTAPPGTTVTERIEALDLEPIVFKLTHPDDGETPTFARCWRRTSGRTPR